MLFGGETLKDFAFALLVGIASGTYSSIFIAAPVLTAWKEREPVYVQRRHRAIETFGMVPAFAVAATAGVPAGPATPSIEIGRRSGGNGRADVDEPSPDEVDLRYEPEPAPPEEEMAQGAEVAEAATVAGDESGTDGVKPAAAPRPPPSGRKKQTRAQRRRKGRNR
jgi:SecD/SecF fusion protein